MTTENIFEALRNWKNLIDSYTSENDTNGVEIWNYLNQGTHFSISGKEIELWARNLEKEEIKRIHAYIGIHEKQLKFFLINSKSDKDADFSTVIVKDFLLNFPESKIESSNDMVVLPTTITAESAINRNFRWNMFGMAWLHSQKNKDLFQVISIPFSDYEKMGIEGEKTCTSFFGLTDDMEKKDPDFPYHIEIITVKSLAVDHMSETAENYSTPRPPFSVDTLNDYQLLKQSSSVLV
ncbi:Uncharacterised protein [Chryseobacterium nakagawai]|uniref:Uncharacterized protein n=1 Tax=Chryseobacterium nakagawai TaxID=1241982 RepID=A0AAD0YK08_CHRNA|nr:hypothetical protein [Chryseobacterium nakagawai]AZA90312.1 hypothetical protein EG343_06615 [Chryseobacterium nakagawai]VEH21793.1 Uncharacterised protein [Chryseobacterium nakagawai]